MLCVGGVVHPQPPGRASNIEGIEMATGAGHEPVASFRRGWPGSRGRRPAIVENARRQRAGADPLRGLLPLCVELLLDLRLRRDGERCVLLPHGPFLRRRRQEGGPDLRLDVHLRRDCDDLLRRRRVQARPEILRRAAASLCWRCNPDGRLHAAGLGPDTGALRHGRHGLRRREPVHIPHDIVPIDHHVPPIHLRLGSGLSAGLAGTLARDRPLGLRLGLRPHDSRVLLLRLRRHLRRRHNLYLLRLRLPARREPLAECSRGYGECRRFRGQARREPGAWRRHRLDPVQPRA
mmetsp:Transcript_41636/g.120784  ORF Transcript_41636/g.120784 Transcript_41636/m.120784 type:complete len:292 (+) Transcript_41636:601-1476(+)